MDYTAVNAKVKAMRANLLTKPQYQLLCQSKSGSHYFEQLKGYQAYSEGRFSESMLSDSLNEEYKRLRLFMGNGEGRRILYLAEQQDFMKAWSFVRTLPASSANRQALTYIKGSEIDLNNLLRIYRLKRYFQNAEIYPQLIPVCYKLSKENIKQMAESPGVGEFIVALKHSPYAGLSFENAEISLEREISFKVRHIYSKMEKRYPRSLAGVLGYFFSKRIEINNLNTISEGIKYQLPAEEIFGELML